jgi:predicted RNase H-like nuclease (RuvC/YqgF family)
MNNKLFEYDENGHITADGQFFAKSGDYSVIETLNDLAKENAELKAEVERLKATLDGDPSQNATPEQRRAWRASAVRYADKLEAEIAELKSKLETASYDDEISAYLAQSKELEGGLFVDISIQSIEGKTFCVRKDWYTVENGIVYEVGDGRKYATGDSLWNVKKSCKRVGKYKPDEIHKFVTKHYSYAEFKGLLKI